MTFRVIKLNRKQTKYLKENFATTKNKHLAEELGISMRSVCRLARKYGLVKDAEYTRIWAIENLAVVPAEAKVCGTREHMIKIEENTRFQKGHQLHLSLTPEKVAEMKKKRLAGYMKARADEKRRLMFGLPQKTKMRVHRQSSKLVSHRYYLKTRGYWLVEGKLNRRTAFYDGNTLRSPKIELEHKYYEFKELSIMNIKELKIGNQVYFKEEVREVRTIVGGVAIFTNDENNKESGVPAYSDEVLPITLTKELVAKLGFIQDKNDEFGHTYIHPEIDKYSFTFGHCLVTLHQLSGERQLNFVCEYLHQLQNFLSAVGEKEVRL